MESTLEDLSFIGRYAWYVREGFPRLQDAFQHDERVGAAIDEACKPTVDDWDVTEAIPMLKDLLGSKDARVRKDAARILTVIGSGGKADVARR